MRGGLLFTFLFSSSLVVFAQGCSSSSSSNAGGSCANYVSALRDAAKECGRFSISPTREPEYIARFQRACEAVLNAPGSGVAPSVLDQCAAQIRAQCGNDDACEGLLDDVRGTLAVGTACSDDTQCVSGECRRETTSQVTPACGTCAALKQLGEPCDQAGCVAGAVCSSGTSSERVCVVLRSSGEGEPCGSTNPKEVVRCASGLYCRLESVTSGVTPTCAAPLGEGEPCGTQESGTVRCKAPFSCVNERCGRLLGAGQACRGSDDCASGLGCDPGNGTCTAIVWGPNGAACDDNLRRCDRGFCARSTSGPSESGTCVDYIADGQPCDQTKSLEQRCDTLSRCIDGTCQFEDPAQCK